MIRGARILGCTAVLAIAACSTDRAKLEIRSTPSRIAAGEKPVSFRVAEARGQLALGNVALALESFRKAAREDPASVDALVGIAYCYDQMGRFDLSRRSYEMALALEPGNSVTLTALAQSLERQGRTAEASSVRAEIAQRLAAAIQPQTETFAQVAPIAEPVQLALPARIAIVPAAPGLQAAPLQASSRLLPVSAARMIVEPDPVATAPAIAAAAKSAAPETAAPVDTAALKAAAPISVASSTPIGQSVTIALPPPRPAVVAEVDIAPPVTLASARAVEVAVSPEFRSAAIQPARKPVADERQGGPRLERLSLGEVALITTRQPQWRPQLVAQSDRSTTVRFVPLKQARNSPSIRLLNAARHEGLAARTRSILTDRGWQRIAIGDAPAIRNRSVILYPLSRRGTARALANQFGFPIEPRVGGREITVLLGRDAVQSNRKRSNA